MKIDELDRVALACALPEFDLCPGDLGTVVHVYPSGELFEVEFVSLDGRTIAVETLGIDQIRTVQANEVAAARAFG